MDRSPKAAFLSEFPPVEYYEVWAYHFNIDTQKYPYIIMDYDPSVKRQAPFAIWDFFMNSVDGWPCASATLIYKAVHGKSRFRRHIYILSDRVETPLPHRDMYPSQADI